jgi:hypothetical protein
MASIEMYDKEVTVRAGQIWGEMEHLEEVCADLQEVVLILGKRLDSVMRKEEPEPNKEIAGCDVGPRMVDLAQNISDKASRFSSCKKQIMSILERLEL